MEKIYCPAETQGKGNSIQSYPSEKGDLCVYEGNSSKEFQSGLKCLGAYMSTSISAKCSN